jgi:hypothetical protein
MFKDVFISHAKEDIDFAEQLYDHLSEKGYSPWLDKKKLKVGANWDYEIKKALKNSTFVILLLSSASVKKRGYIQKEFKYALEYSESKLIDDIYIIPILLDKCEVPNQLSKFQWIEVGQENFRQEILSSLNYQRQKYLSTLSPDSIELNDYTTISIDLNVEVKNKIDYQCELPLFHTNTFFGANFVNTFIQQKALETISNYRSWIIEIKDFIEQNEMPCYIDIHYNINFLTKDFLSLSIVNDSFIGGAHPNTSMDTLNFKFNPDTVIKLRDLIQYNDIKEFLTECINKYGDEEQQESLVRYVEYISDDTVNFVFNDKTLELIFINELPRVIMALGFLEVPLADLKLRF